MMARRSEVVMRCGVAEIAEQAGRTARARKA
jgi:hypothetical protein